MSFVKERRGDKTMRILHTNKYPRERGEGRERGEKGGGGPGRGKKEG